MFVLRLPVNQHTEMKLISTSFLLFSKSLVPPCVKSDEVLVVDVGVQALLHTHTHTSLQYLQPRQVLIQIVLMASLEFS